MYSPDRQVSGPYNCAQFTVELYRNLVGSCKWGTAGQLMDAVREVGKELVAAKPSELAVGNMVRKQETRNKRQEET